MASKDTDHRAADDLIQIFETQILKGELGIGDPLPPEREIVQAYNVSRTVVREAILALSNKGLIDARPRFRPVVRAPSYDAALQAVGPIAARFVNTPQGTKNLFDLRITLEAGLVREAAISAKPDHLRQLKDALAANEAAIEEPLEFYETDISFHSVLYDIPDNSLLPAIHRAYTGWLNTHWSNMPRDKNRNTRNFQAHTRIFEAILMRDADEAELALRTHLSEAWEQVSVTFTGTDGDEIS